MDDKEFELIRLDVLAKYSKPAAVGAVVFAYFASPILRYIDPFWLYPLGGLLAVGCVLVIAGLTVASLKAMVPITSVGVALMAVATVGLAYRAVPAQSVARHMDLQCQILEQDMMRIKPARTDSHDLYAALGCRPQATSTLRIPAGKGWVQDEHGIILEKP